MKKQINPTLTVVAIIASILQIVFQYTFPLLSIFALRLAGVDIEYNLSSILSLYVLSIVGFFVKAFFEAVKKELKA